MFGSKANYVFPFSQYQKKKVQLKSTKGEEPWSGCVSLVSFSSLFLIRRNRIQSLTNQNLGFSLTTITELVFPLVVVTLVVGSWSKCTFRPLPSLPLGPHNQPRSPISEFSLCTPRASSSSCFNQTCLAWQADVSEGHSNIPVITFKTLSPNRHVEGRREENSLHTALTWHIQGQLLHFQLKCTLIFPHPKTLFPSNFTFFQHHGNFKDWKCPPSDLAVSWLSLSEGEGRLCCPSER